MVLVKPMLATSSPAPPTGTEWTYEVKWDGVRVLADTTGQALRLLSRTGRDVADTYPELAGLAGLPGAVLDGEVVAMADGVPSFAALAGRSGVRSRARAEALARTAPVTYMIFDVLTLYGVDLTRRPLSDRRATLERLDLPERCALSPVYPDGAALWEATRAHDLEGVVAKRRTSFYQPGRRSPDWVKATHRASRTALVGGWRPESTSRERLGAVLLGAPDGDGRLRYLGRAGSGLSERWSGDLARRLALLPSVESPFADEVPEGDAQGTTWCRPSVAVEVAYLERTRAGRLRHPVLLGVREDAEPDPWTEA